MRRYLILRSTNVGGKGAEPGDKLPLPDHVGRALVRLGKARELDAQDEPVSPPADPGILTSEALRPFLDPNAAAEAAQVETAGSGSSEDPVDEDELETPLEEDERDAPPVEYVAPAVEHRDPRPRRRGR